jgi:hypothetical protein
MGAFEELKPALRFAVLHSYSWSMRCTSLYGLHLDDVTPVLRLVRPAFALNTSSLAD